MTSRYPSPIPSSRSACPGSNLNFLRMIRAGEMFLDANDPPGPPPVVNPPVDPPANQPSVADAVKNALAEILGAKNGDKDSALETLIRRNHALELRASAAESKAAKKSDLDELEAWRSVAREQGWDKPETAKSKYLQAQQGASEAATLKRESAMRLACEAAGLDFTDFSTRKGVDDVAYSVKSEGEGDKKQNVAYVTITDEAGKTSERKLAEWAGEKFPRLAQATGDSSGKGNSGGQNKGAGSGRPFVQQGVNGGTGSVYDRIRETMKAEREKPRPPTEDAARRSGLR